MGTPKKGKKRLKNLKIDADTHMRLSVYCSFTKDTMTSVATKFIERGLPVLPKPDFEPEFTVE